MVTYTYNGAGSVLTQTTGTHTTTYTYDRYQNVATLEDALSQTESYSYTPNGSLTSKTDRNGTDFTYGIDGLGRTLIIHASKSAATQNHTTAYSYGGQVSSISADGVTTSHTYDGYGRVILELNLVTLGASGIPSQKAYTYDLSGRMLTSAITVNGVTNTTSYTYDRLGRVVTVKDNGDTEATYTYDANGNRATMTLGNGEVTTYTYHLANLVKTLVNKDESNNTLSSCSYLYRLDGNQVGKQESTKTTLYAYDDLGRLTAESVTEGETTVTTGYTFDDYNNRATKTIGASTVGAYTYDANDRMLTETTGLGTTNYTYDNNGSQLTTTIGSSTTSNAYDLFGQLKSYTGADSVVTNYSYGPDGMRTSKTSGNTSTAYVWDGGNIVNEFISVTEGQTTTTTENRYVYGIGRIKAFLGTVEVYYLYNAHGDVTGLTNASCDLTKSYVYDAFGIEVDLDPADANLFRYCGEYFDKETETYYLRARNYKPKTGRFTQQDPIGDGLNWYVYCNNNPVSFVDPSGCVIGLPWDEEERNIVLYNLQQLTDHILTAVQDEDGAWIVNIEISSDNSLPSGNALIINLIDSEYTVTIYVYDGSSSGTDYDFNDVNAYNGTGVNAAVYFNPYWTGFTWVLNTVSGFSVLESIPIYITLAHELIHADRAMRGIAISKEEFGQLIYTTGERDTIFGKEDIMISKSVLLEEFATIGIYNKNVQLNDITENLIRKEHGLQQRTGYDGMYYKRSAHAGGYKKWIRNIK